MSLIGFSFIAEVHDLETNQELNQTLNSMQMPKVEYKEITVDGQSMCLLLPSQSLPRAPVSQLGLNLISLQMEIGF